MRILFTLCLFLFLSCSNTKKNLPAGLQYLPDIDVLQEGVIFKYYVHKSKAKGHPKTDILYRKMTLVGDVIINEDFNAAFDKTYHYENKIEGSKWITLNEKSINSRNVYKELYREYAYDFKSNIHTDWSGNDALLEKSIMYENSGTRIVILQTEAIDSIVNGNKAKVFYGNRTFYNTVGEEEKDPATYDVYKEYQEGLGMTHSILFDSDLKFEKQLDEVMSAAEFERRRNHGTHRVAYIDTLLTIDDHTLFQPCFHSSKINDYYNDQRSGFKGGKGRLRALLNEKLDPEKIKGESGYLTFRFVINCKGEAGWFVTEEAELDYQKKRFSDVCRMHLYEILKAEKEWENLVIWEEDRDAYTYITFKMKNGEIIELLP